jgi:type IV pilus assembly protein PilM
MRRTYLALDITPRQLRAIAMRRRGKASSLTGGRVLSLPEGVLTLSVREPNILDSRRFVEAVQELLDPLAGREERLALCLPDAVGRVMLVETETALRTREEGVDILKWQLKSSLPDAPKDVQLDFQVLHKSETGRFQVVTSFIAGRVLQQYEELLGEAGYGAAVVDFHSLSVYNYYRPRLDLGEDFILIGVEGGSLSVQLFQGQILCYHRCREVDPSPAGVFQELSRSLAGAQEQYPGFRRAAAFLHCDWADPQPLLAAVRSAFEREEMQLLDPHLERLAAAGVETVGRAGTLVAAVGAAERLM